MARAQLVLAFIALVILAAGIAGATYYWQNIARPDFSMTEVIEGRSSNKKEIPDLGKRHFEKAVDLLKKGELQAAKETLYYLLEYYPESKTFGEARRILGEVNMDLLISKTPIPGKTEYVVRSGDAPTTIARKNNTTINYLMRANAKTRALIYRDERLTVYPLNFEIDINLADKKIVVSEQGKFFKEYDIVEINLPGLVKPPVSTVIKEKVAWGDDRRLDFAKKEYLGSEKWMRTGKIGLFIRSPQEKPAGEVTSQSKKYGVMVTKPDIEELFTVIRSGSPVRLNP